jgi:hypothetical protein
MLGTCPEEPCVASSILALGTEPLFGGLFPQRVFGRAASARRKQMVRMFRYTLGLRHEWTPRCVLG